MNKASLRPTVVLVALGLMAGTSVLGASCASGPTATDRHYVIDLERVTDVDCEQPGGWTNLFFTANSAAPGEAVAAFAEVSPGFPIEIVRRTNNGGEVQYGIRVPVSFDEEVLDFSPTRLGTCATAELQLDNMAQPLRIQISTAEDWVYGRIAEYRAGHLTTNEHTARVEVYPRNRDAVGLNRIERVEVFVGANAGDSVRKFSQRLESGEVVFSDQVGSAFRVGNTPLMVDSLSTDSGKLFLSEIADVALPYRGFVAPAFTGTVMGGTARRLSDFAGQVVVIEFWSTECPFSEMARPEANQLAAALESTGGTLIAMSRESDVDMLQRYLAMHPRVSQLLFRDEDSWQRWNPETVTPLYYVIGRDGRVLLRERGAHAVRLAAAVAGVTLHDID